MIAVASLPCSTNALIIGCFDEISAPTAGPQHRRNRGLSARSFSANSQRWAAGSCRQQTGVMIAGIIVGQNFCPRE